MKEKRSILIVANWKLNPCSREQAKDLANKVLEGLKNKLSNSVKVILCVPSPYLLLIQDIIANTDLKLGAQNCYFEEKGAFTGEISPLMLKDLNCQFVILGHSERRSLFQEKDSVISQKAQAVIKSSLIPIICIGETLEEREENKTDSIILNQLTHSLKSVKTNGGNLIIAYEPVWAIGSGKTCSSEEANRVCALIRSFLRKIYNEEISQKVFILYGGSVKASTIEEQIKQTEIDGVLVGGASLIAEEFIQLVSQAHF